MKNLLLLLTCIGCTAVLHAQSDPWFQPGAYWKIHYESLGGPGDEILQYAGPGAAGGEQCTRLHWYAYHYGFPFGQGFVDYGHQYLLARNDSVLWWRDDHFQLLYDFTRQAGDTLWLQNSIYQYALVEATGDTVWNGIPTRYQNLLLVWQPGGGDTLRTPTRVYERLGGQHLLWWDIESPLTEIQYELVCYNDAEYPDPACLNNPFSGYQSFPFGLARWSEEDGIWCYFTGRQFVLQGDTVVPGYSWSKKLFVRNTYTGSNPCPNASATMLNEPLQLIGAISQDLAGKKVYFTAYGNNNPNHYPANLDPANFPQPDSTRLLYDFDLQPGQILDWKPGPNIVAYHDSILLNDLAWRRRYFFMDDQGNVDTSHWWLEGIGGSNGLFTGWVNIQATDVYSVLHCFRENNILRYNAVNAVFCDSITVAAPEAPALETRIRLYPNPASGSVTVEIPPDAAPAMLYGYDLLGREVLACALPGPLTTLPLPPGLSAPALLLRIRDKDGREAGKVLRIRH